MENTESQINYDDFAKIDIRVGLVTFCENVAKSEKLLRLEVDFGDLGKRQILTGMAKWYKPEEFIGKKMLFLFNLEVRKMMGLESQGMVLSVGSDDEDPILMFAPEGASLGSVLK